MKILNLYSGIGGNRKLWSGVQVTAVEYDSKIARIYSEQFPDDEVIVGDAHQYLLDHYDDFDLIWSSPPCQSHSSFRFNIGVRYRGVKAEYPDMRLYQEILFLQHHRNKPWVVENVKPYYEPLIKPSAIVQRHYFWSNYEIPNASFQQDKIRTAQIPDLEKLHGFNLANTDISNKRQVLRNCVYPPLGLYVMKCSTL